MIYIYKLKLLILMFFLIFPSNLLASKKDISRINSLYEEGLLSRAECIKAKKKILGSSSKPDCKKKKNC